MIPSRRHRVTVRAVDAYSALVEEFAAERYPHTWQEMDMTQLRVEYARELGGSKNEAMMNPIRKSVFELTKHEVEIVKLIGRGWTTEQIADKFDTSNTVIRGTYLNQIYQKLDIHKIVHLAIYAHKAGYVTLDDIDFGRGNDNENRG